MEEINKGKLTLLAESKDELDSFIMNEIMFNLGSSLANAFFQSGDKKHDAYFEATHKCSIALLKANEHKRNYLDKEKKIIDDFKLQAVKDTNENITLGRRPIELLSEVDSYFMQIKCAFDYLAQILNPFFNINLDAWHKGKYKGVEKSGARILYAMDNNLDEVTKNKIAPLRRFIEQNMDWVTYLVRLRDNPLHKGGDIDNPADMIIIRKIIKFRK